MTLLDATLTLLDATWRYMTLLDAIVKIWNRSWWTVQTPTAALEHAKVCHLRDFGQFYILDVHIGQVSFATKLRISAISR
jgi:hypothetical protein